MNTISLIYKNNKEEKRKLTYNLFMDQSATQKWINMWVKFFESNEQFTVRSENPTIIKSLEYYQNDLYEKCYKLVNDYNIDLLKGWDNKNNYTQDFLNVLHDDFVENTNISSDPEVVKLLNLVNHSIHTLESAMRTPQNYKANYFKSVLRWPWPDTVWAQAEIDENDQKGNVTWFKDEHCLFLAYATLGKDLNMILNDEHYDLIKTEQVMPKTKISPWMSFCIPYKDGNSSDEYRINLDNSYIEEFYNKAETKKDLLDEYNIDYKSWKHKPGRIVIGLNENGSMEDWYWFVDNSDEIVLSEIIFNTDLLNATACLIDSENYNWII